jgi:hypothetical protein
MAATIATTGGTAIVHGTSLAPSPSDAPRVMKEETAAPTRCSPLRSMVFKISNDSIMICRYPSGTVSWDPAMDHGNLTDLTAFLQPSILAIWPDNSFRPDCFGQITSENFAFEFSFLSIRFYHHC